MTYDLDAFDEEVFEETKAIMKARFGDMIHGYLEDAQTYIGKIKEGFEVENKKQVAQYAHPLKSSSASLGVMSVSAIAKDLENGVNDAIDDDADIESYAALVVPLEEAFRRAEVKFKTFS